MTNYKSRKVLLNQEQSTTPITDSAEINANTGVRWYSFFTLPTEYDFYLITGIEWKNGSAVAGNTITGISIVDANPPVSVHTREVARGTLVANTGTSSVQRDSAIYSQLIKGGTILGAWLSTSDQVTQEIRNTTKSSSNSTVDLTDITGVQALSSSTAWTASTTDVYLKVYYQGI